MTAPTTITIDNTKYVREDSLTAPVTGSRVIVVVDRGWIFAGDSSIDPETRERRLSRAVHVMEWSEGGIAGLAEDPLKAEATLKRVQDVVIPGASIVFTIPVSDSWGL